MKKVLIIFLVFSLIGCSNKSDISFQEIDNVKYLNQNKSNITSAIVRKVTNGSGDCYSVISVKDMT